MASAAAGEVHQSVEAGITNFTKAHGDFKSGTAGFASATALSDILVGWESRFSAVRDKCKGLDDELKKAGSEFDSHEHGTKKSFDKQGK
ncbi:hypothetical protein FHS39_001160 [Streptomyces olivoverticillatus]|uniref:Uncharacterized protein n=1 Tax=Streptomyces olivoverticillatus TaxID=66427 RepID=A0A7W7LKX7_9ACTN|nr:hypothetical protein [Streptomyces olivoverticillatus]MBB4892149.1 hypothetical protein [Streptomyces olivoverticillatus]